MNSNHYQKLLEQILWELAQNNLAHNIEEIIIAAIATQKADPPENPSHWHFTDLVAFIVTYLHENYPKFLSRPSPEEASILGFYWLDQNFPTDKTPGSENALLEFIQGKPFVLDKIGQALATGFITREQNRACKRVVAQRIGDDWEHRHRLAQAFLTEFGTLLPPEITNQDPRNQADSIEQLILDFSRARASVRELVSGR